MGWASGSGLMSEIIEALKAGLPDDGARRKVYGPIIKAFEGHDCDTLSDCLGDDPAFDAAYCEANPTEAGLQAAKAGQPRAANPHPKRSKAARDWDEGWDWFHS